MAVLCESDVKSVSVSAGFAESRKNCFYFLFPRFSGGKVFLGEKFKIDFFSHLLHLFQKNRVKSVSVKAYLDIFLAFRHLFNLSFSCGVKELFFEGNISV